MDSVIDSVLRLSLLLLPELSAVLRASGNAMVAEMTSEDDGQCDHKPEQAQRQDTPFYHAEIAGKSKGGLTPTVLFNPA